jgi:hypothetical protein
MRNSGSTLRRTASFGVLAFNPEKLPELRTRRGGCRRRAPRLRTANCQKTLSPERGTPRMVRTMSIGTGIVLFVIGAVLAFGLNLQADWVDLDLVGYIFMGAGLVVFIVGLVLMMRKRQSVTTVSNGVDANGNNVAKRTTAETPDNAVL